MAHKRTHPPLTLHIMDAKGKEIGWGIAELQTVLPFNGGTKLVVTGVCRMTGGKLSYMELRVKNDSVIASLGLTLGRLLNGQERDVVGINRDRCEFGDTIEFGRLFYTTTMELEA